MRRALVGLIGFVLTVGCAGARAEDRPPTAAGAAAAASQPGKLPHIQVDVKARQVRVECEPCSENMDVGLEFFCVATGTNEYESVLRSRARASHFHLAMLMIGLEPGAPVSYSEAAKKWIPPHGPPLQITCEWKKATGETVRVPAYRLMRNIKTKQEARPFTWVFTGSKVMEDGKYAADAVGYFVSVLNNELTVIDVPEVAARALESREWERNVALLPAADGKATVWMIVEPAGNVSKGGAPAATEPKADAVADVGEIVVSVGADGKVKVDGMTVTVERLPEALGNRRVPAKVRLEVAPGAPAADVQRVNDALHEVGGNVNVVLPKNGVTDVSVDEQRMKGLKERWERSVAPHDKALREAAQAHYEVIESMRREQQRLIDEAERIQRVIDELQKQYQDMTTPRPEPVKD